MANNTQLHLGIDASNIRQGGGITHLSRLLQAGDPISSGISCVSVWCSKSTAALLPDFPWLQKLSPAWIEAGGLMRAVGQQLLLPLALRAVGCDALFSPGGTTPAYCGVPVVTMSQNMLPFEPLEAARFGRWSRLRLKMWILRCSQGRSFRRADGLIFLTNYAQTAVSSALGGIRAATALIPHGIEPRFFCPPRPQRSWESCTISAPFRLLYVSILMPYKHQVAVANAVAVLRAQGLPIEIFFAGASWGDYGRRFGELLNTLDPAQEFLHWSGAAAFDALHTLYRQADGFVFASSCENLPNILVEAMAAGLPIASSDRGPMPEVLGDAAIYFDPDQPGSVELALRSFVMDAQRRQRLANLAWQEAQPYSWERCARDTFSFIALTLQRQRAA